MRLLIPLLSILSVVSACSQTELRPVLDVPAELLAPTPQPVMHGTTNADVWRLIARQKAAISEGNSKLAAIGCIERSRQAIINGGEPPDCGEI